MMRASSLWYCYYFVLSAHGMKDSFAALVKSTTAAPFRHSFEEKLHGLYLLSQGIQFCQFSLREFLPPIRYGRGGAKAKKELAYFVQRESHLPRTLHQRKPVQNAVIVASLSARALCFGKNPYLLVIADG
jgi:hypothetical protein